VLDLLTDYGFPQVRYIVLRESSADRPPRLDVADARRTLTLERLEELAAYWRARADRKTRR